MQDSKIIMSICKIINILKCHENLSSMLTCELIKLACNFALLMITSC